MAAEGFGELLDGVAEHRAGHRGGIFIEKEFEAAPVALAGFAEHPADGLVHQVVLMGHQLDSQRVSVVELAVPDQSQSRDDGDSLLPQQSAVRQ